jgi:asparagine synthase (glutamine-hydrolysing)
LLRGWRPGAPAWPPEIDQRRVATPLHITNYLSSAEKAELFNPGCLFADSNEVLRRDVGRVRDDHPLHQSLYLYCHNWLVEDLLMKADKMTMAASLELRTPFLDYRMVEWAARAPASAKVRRLADGRYITKAVLRDHARDRLPATTIDRPKKGFPVPVFDWLSTRLRPFTMDLLGPQAKCSRWLDANAVRCVAENGTKLDAPIYDRHRTWNLLVLELWARAWLP